MLSKFLTRAGTFRPAEQWCCAQPAATSAAAEPAHAAAAAPAGTASAATAVAAVAAQRKAGSALRGLATALEQPRMLRASGPSLNRSSS